MKSDTERRAYKRSNMDSWINYSYYGTEHQLEAKMLNCSLGGLQFNADLPIEPGSYISIMMADESEESSWPWQKDQESRCAEVAWCNRMGDEDLNYYGIGVKYYE